MVPIGGGGGGGVFDGVMVAIKRIHWLSVHVSVGVSVLHVHCGGDDGDDGCRYVCVCACVLVAMALERRGEEWGWKYDGVCGVMVGQHAQMQAIALIDCGCGGAV